MTTFEFEETPAATSALNACMKVVGIGGAGGNAVNRMIDEDLEGVAFLSLNTDAQARLAGYRRAVAEGGLDADPAVVVGGDFTEQSGHAAAATLLALADRPTAVFAANDSMAELVARHPDPVDGADLVRVRRVGGWRSAGPDARPRPTATADL